MQMVQEEYLEISERTLKMLCVEMIFWMGRVPIFAQRSNIQLSAYNRDETCR